jgi:Ion channel
MHSPRGFCLPSVTPAKPEQLDMFTSRVLVAMIAVPSYIEIDAEAIAKSAPEYGSEDIPKGAFRSSPANPDGAATYSLVGATPAGASHLYLTFVNYTTLGYGDIVPTAAWQLLGPITAMNGILLFGWSTAVIFDVVRTTTSESQD